MLRFSRNAGGLAGSQTLAITTAAKRMIAQGVDVAPFAAGDPDLDTPEFVREAGIQAIRDGRTKYGPVAGMRALREAVAAQMTAQRKGSGLPKVRSEQTIITAGAKSALFLSLQVLLEPGDEVIVPAPCWESYARMIQAAGAQCVFVHTRPEGSYLIDPDRLAAAVTPRTRAILLNSPGNPTGAVQPDEVQRAIGRTAVEHGLAVISDEIYEHLTYAPARFTSFAALAPEARDLTLTVNGVSKSFAMTGWRIGYAAGPKAWIRRMVRLQSHALSGPPDITQCAALAALTGPEEERARVLTESLAIYRERRDLMHELLNAVPGLRCPMPDGAFYVFPDVSRYLDAPFNGKRIGRTSKLAQHLLEHAHAAVVPGDVFAAPYALRFSYVCSRDVIRRGISRVADFLASLEV